jgi:hypothetical protein
VARPCGKQRSKNGIVEDFCAYADPGAGQEVGLIFVQLAGSLQRHLPVQ